MSWAHFLNDGAANYLPGVLPALLLELQLAPHWAGTIMGALLIGQGLQPFVGLVGDRLGGRALVVVGLFGSSLGGALIGFTGSVGSLVAALVVIGVSNSLFHPQALAGVKQLASGGHGMALSVFLVGGEIGRGLWPAMASALVVAHGRASLWLLALPAVVTLPILWHWAPSLPRRSVAATIDWRRHAGPLSRLVGLSALRAVMMFAVITFLPLMWSSAGGSLTAGASLITVMLVVGIVGNLAGGRLADHIGSRPVLVVGLTLSTLALVGVLLLKGVWLWLACAVFGIAIFSTLPLTILIAQRILPENRSFGSGLALGLANALGAIGLVAISPLVDLGGPSAPLWAALVCGVGTIILAPTMPEGVPEQ